MAEVARTKPHTSWINIVVSRASIHWDSRSIKRLIFFSYQTVVAAGLGSFNFGYANNVIAGTFGQPTFLTKFLSGADAAARTDGIIGW
jgi:hypothetical protein